MENTDLHKQILLGLIRVNPDTDIKDFRRNYSTYETSVLRFTNDEDIDIAAQLKKFYGQYQEPPTINALIDYYRGMSSQSTKVKAIRLRLDELQAGKVVQPFKADFEDLVKRAVQSQRENDFGVLLQKAARILHDGLMEKKGKQDIYLKGTQDAMTYVLEQAPYFLTSSGESKSSGELREDVEDLRKELEDTLAHPSNAWGRATGLDPIDRTCRGLKPGEFWIHAAFTGELKTTFALNWAYKQAFIYKYNALYFSLEMPYEQIRKKLAVMHSANPKFVQAGYPILDYRTIRDGIMPDGSPLSQELKDFYLFLLDDMEKGDYGKLFIEAPPKKVTILDIKTRAEILHRQEPIHMLVVDHLLLVKPDKSTADRRGDLNDVIKDCRQMALHFNNGEKMPVLGLLQINRQGKLEADKNDGLYKMQALAEANEAERSADVITCTYLNPELRKAAQTKVTNLKNRDNPLFNPFTASIDWPSQYIGHSLEDELANIPDISALENSL